MAGERDLQQYQELNRAVEQTLEARAQQIGRLLHGKCDIKERVRMIADYITVKCRHCEDMTRSILFAVMEDLHHLQGDLAHMHAARPNVVPQDLGALEDLMYS